jgi:hypothetical protein
MDPTPEGEDALQMFRKLIEEFADGPIFQEKFKGEADDTPIRLVFRAIARSIGDTTVQSLYEGAMEKCFEMTPENFDKLVEDYEREHGVTVFEKIDQFFEKIKTHLNAYLPSPDAAEDIIRDIHTGNPDQFRNSSAGKGEAERAEESEEFGEEDGEEGGEDNGEEDGEGDDGPDEGTDPNDEDDEEDGEAEEGGEDDGDGGDGEWEGWRFDDDEDEEEEE